MITCKEFTEEWVAYREGEPLQRASRAGMWMHRVMCGPCRRYVKQVEQVLELAPELDPDEQELACPEDLKSDLVKKYKKTNPGPMG